MKRNAEAARRRDSDDEDAPTSALPKRGQTPDGSRWGGGSNAGESRMGDSKSGAPAAKAATTSSSSVKMGGLASMATDNLDNELWNEKLAQVRDCRNKLDEKIKSSKKKSRKKSKKKSNLKGSQWG